MITRRRFLKFLAALGLSGVAVASFAVIETLLQPRITRYSFRPNRWPRDLEVTIAVLADLHACEPWMPAERIASIVQTTNGLGADMIVMGAFAHSRLRHLFRGSVTQQLVERTTVPLFLSH